MSGDKRQYTIQFVYTDNSQIFQTGAQLTEEEARRLEKSLSGFAEAGAIEQQSVYEPKTIYQDFDTALAEVIEALKWEIGDSQVSQCENCGVIWPDATLITPVPDLSEGVADGELMSGGACPSCGGLCFSRVTV